MAMRLRPHRFRRAAAGLITLLAAVDGVARAAPADLVLDDEARRIETVARVAPSAVCVFDSLMRGGGSGVLIDPDGYGLTNYHVVAGLLDKRTGWGGLGDGVLYELEVLGIDVTGDVAMFRLIPPKAGFRFPYARLGDSDAVRIGEAVMAMGNPFSLSEDYAPTVTLGIVTGVHRYQRGVEGNLVYTDCIQVDASINPGSSGGPLFNAAGEIIGINGRISVNTRGRFNVGFGYAISSNQIKRFIPTLRAGLLARHGTLGAVVDDDRPEGPSYMPEDRRYAGGVGVRFTDVREKGPAYDAGIRPGDRLLSFDGVRIRDADHLASVLGTYPAEWPVRLRIERDGTRWDAVVALEAVQPNMRRPFRVDRRVNERQVRRVLRAFQRAVYAGDGIVASPVDRPHPAGGYKDAATTFRRPSRWRWVAVRTNLEADENTVVSSERFEVRQSGDGPIRMQERFADGSAGRLIEFTDDTARQRAAGGDEWHEVPDESRMLLGARYVMHRWLLEPFDKVDLTGVMHAGGGAVLEPVDGLEPRGLKPAALNDGGARIKPRLLEVIEWPVTDRALARFGFDGESSVLVRITVRDLFTGDEATVDLGDYQDIGGLIWPCVMEVKGDGYRYCETWSRWELSP